jgi:protoporphyrinogen IX oxidase
MPWLKLLHITAVVLWCGALLYLPAAIAAASGTGPAAVFERPGQRVLRSLFTLVVTPAALVAIASGTAIFVLHGPLASWLIVKLAAVGLLVLGHAACGLLILRAERGEAAYLRTLSGLVAVSSLTWLAAIAGLVLMKPLF